MTTFHRLYLSTMKQILFPVISRFLLILAIWQVAGGSRCREPDNINDLKDAILGNPTHESVYLNPNHRNGDLVHHTGHRRSSGTRQCRAHHISNESEPIRKASVCPWYYARHSDVDRIPQTVTEAVCQCNRCRLFGPEGGRTTSRCQPVYYYIRALRRTCGQSGVYNYTRVLEPIRVACVCRPAHVEESDGGHSSGIRPQE